MDFGWLAALITAMTGLFGMFFGRRYWKMLDDLVHEQARRIERLEKRIDEVRQEKRDLYQRFDELERTYFKLKAENERLRDQLNRNEQQT